MPKYTAHALARILERGISKHEVEQSLADPIDTRIMRNGRTAACSRPKGGRCLIVIFEQTDEDLIVVTALKVSSERAKRYGFTGV